MRVCGCDYLLYETDEIQFQPSGIDSFSFTGTLLQLPITTPYKLLLPDYWPGDNFIEDTTGASHQFEDRFAEAAHIKAAE